MDVTGHAHQGFDRHLVSGVHNDQAQCQQADRENADAPDHLLLDHPRLPFVVINVRADLGQQTLDDISVDFKRYDHQIELRLDGDGVAAVEDRQELFVEQFEITLHVLVRGLQVLEQIGLGHWAAHEPVVGPLVVLLNAGGIGDQPFHLFVVGDGGRAQVFVDLDHGVRHHVVRFDEVGVRRQGGR